MFTCRVGQSSVWKRDRRGGTARIKARHTHRNLRANLMLASNLPLRVGRTPRNCPASADAPEVVAAPPPSSPPPLPPPSASASAERASPLTNFVMSRTLFMSPPAPATAPMAPGGRSCDRRGSPR